jgi:two-component system phosphate regulon response regulator PhoB
MNKKKALVLEEDEEFRQLLAEEIRSAGLEVMAFGDPFALLREFSLGPVALVVVDAKVPELPLEEFLGRLGSVGRTEYRVLVMAAPGGPERRRAGLRSEWDDVIEKPIERIRLRERVRTLTDSGTPGPGKLGSGGLWVDPKSFDVFLLGERIHLTPNEFKLLEALLEVPGRVLTREELIQKVQGPGIAVIDRAIDTHVFSLRKKLGTEGNRIETVRGEGYRIRI